MIRHWCQELSCFPEEVWISYAKAREPLQRLVSLEEYTSHYHAARKCGMALAQQVQTEIEKQLAVLPREEIARTSIENNGKIIVAEDFDDVLKVANEIAPEHLELCVDDPFAYLDKIQNTGSIFMGRYCPEALGDYFAGPNHTLPTSGTARFSSPLSTDDFIKKIQYTYYTPRALEEVAQDVALFARKEGLEAHARSALARQEEEA